jgi:DNA-directed RNA polymerase subunit omega
MARVTIEDCVEKVADRFELVAVAAQRAKNILSGAELTIERKGEKDTVISLREIGDGTVEISSLREDLVKSYQRERAVFEDLDEPEGDDFNPIGMTADEIRSSMADEAEEDIGSGVEEGYGDQVYDEESAIAE